MTIMRHKSGPRMSQAVRAGDMVYLSGTIPDDRQADIVAQTTETLSKINTLLAEMGGDKSNLVSMQVWLSDMADFSGMNQAWERWVDPDHAPTRATAGVALASPGVRIEIRSVTSILAK
jgi:enamine deaminase RidA (YjgF/YER057c/UK114 family)